MKIFNPVLLIMQPREIPELIESIKKNIDIETFLFRAFTEPNVCKEINKFIENSNYTHYIISADDIIYDKKASEEVLNLAKNIYESQRCEIVTGWVNLCASCELSNVCLSPLILENKKYPLFTDYPFSTINEIQKFNKNQILITYLTSFAFSCIPKDIIQKYPMMTYSNSYASDHNFSYRYYLGHNKGALTTNTMFFYHLKKSSISPIKDYWLVNKQEPKIIKFI
jgi:hypothetical protein